MFLLGGGEGEPRGAEKGKDLFNEKPRRGVSRVGGGGGPRGREGVSRELGGRGSKNFCSGPKGPPRHSKMPRTPNLSKICPFNCFSGSNQENPNLSKICRKI